MRFKFHEPKDTLMLNFADLSFKEVHAGPLRIYWYWDARSSHVRQ